MRLGNEEVLELLLRMDEGYVPTEVEKEALEGVKELDLIGINLTTLPDSIGNLIGLTILSLRGNQLASLPDSFGNLNALTTLFLDNNYLTSLPDSFGNLRRLTRLGLRGNQLTSLPDSFGNLTALTTLFLEYNCLTSLPDSFGNLTALATLNLSYNRLTSLPDSIGKLTALTTLSLSRNQLTTLPDSFGNLTGLTRLSLISNKLTSLADSFRNLTALTALYLSDNRLTSIPDFFGNLSGLTELSLRINQLTSLPDCFRQLKKLTFLNLSENQLDKLPAYLLRLKLPFLEVYADKFYHRGIFLHGTTLSLQPASLFDQSQDTSPGRTASRKLIEDYFNAKHVPLRESKVILLGDAAAGKTYTVQRLMNHCEKGDYHTETTHGILIEDLHTKRDGADYTVRIWDFGGQDIMNEMHRCFLTERTCYVVLIDTRNNGQTQRARHWLRTVRSVAPESPVVLLVNEMTGSVNWDLDGAALQKEFPNLKEIHHCSAREAEAEAFRREVEQPILRQALGMDSCKMTLPESWEQVRQELLALRDNRFYIDRNGFHALCDKHGVPKDNQLRVWLLNWFNDMGVCFSYHFANGRERQEDYKILEPKWLTSAIYRLIWEKGKTEDGIITRKEIDLILSEEGSKEKQEKGVPCLNGVKYSPTEQSYVLDIMRKFSISYPADSTHEFMPTLCQPDSKKDPAPQNPRQHVSVRFVYELLPETVIHRLMIYCYRSGSLPAARRWLTGFWLEDEERGLSAVLYTPVKDNTLQIDVYAEKETSEVSDWLQPLCKQVVEINDLLRLKAVQEVKAENEKGSEWFKLEARVWFAYKKRAPQLWGDENVYEIKPLLELVYGRWLKKALAAHDVETERKREREPGDTPEKMLYRSIPELIAALDRNTAAHENNTSAVQQLRAAVQENTSAQEQSALLLKCIKNGDIKPPKELMILLLGILKKEKKLCKYVEEIRNRTEQGQMDWLGTFLENAANFATVVQAVAAGWPTIQPLVEQILNI